MKSFLQEYGFAVLAAIVVIVLIMMATPIGTSVKESLAGIVNKYTETANVSLDSASDELANQLNALTSNEGGGASIDVAKGDLINIEGAQYRVLAMNGTQAKVLAMSDATEIKFNDSVVTTSFNGTEGPKYEGSKLDNYLENTWYVGLSQDMKDAIVAQDITQNMYLDSDEPNDSGDFSGGITYKQQFG